jgi:2-octaprenyl-6-methoxyphenol hydroxylase
MTHQNDASGVLIAGGGVAGLTLAIALRQGLGPSFAVTVADPTLGTSHAGDERASAIVAAARRLLEALEVWPTVAREAQPILDMVVTDSRLEDAVRPAFLTFAGEIEPGEPFAHMVENQRLIAALEAKAEELGVDCRRTAVAHFSYWPLQAEDQKPMRGSAGAATARSHRGAQRVHVELADGETITARLLVAADGARSSIRDGAGIASHGWSYGQSAIVTNVAHERDHGGRAEEHFLPAGPFAILPLKGRRSSIVWTESARRLS